MPEYVLVNRRSGKYTNDSKIASRATVHTTLGMLTSARIISDTLPSDPLARHVVLLDADAEQVAALRANLPADSILEPAVRRNLHQRVPIELRPTIPHTATVKAKGTRYNLTVTGGGAPLSNIDVMLYLRDPGGQIRNTTLKTDVKGKLSFKSFYDSVTEVQIDETGKQFFDATGRSVFGNSTLKTGALYGVASATQWAANVASPDGPDLGNRYWNTYEISARGKHIKVTLNGRVVCDADVPAGKRLRGFLGLQFHTGRVQFRNLRLNQVS